ncbi:BTB/POZ domain-containing protein At3g05675-like [Cryptomeria japonica]|uniref:BTB/POZ domain-containing protein At3g05675-like n=1 Tax=Cryptomeria japonica TaxID=3369 RepID=UPI0027DA0802|nr:BTB/POZ domain-containing protein At3g05675-like [Cryptomeria japonica]
MEEAQLRFADITSADVKADVKLWLTGTNGEIYERNLIYLHSAIMKRSQFFEVMMSDRWSSGKPTEISVTTSHNFDEYIKCNQLIYRERMYFSNIEECLAILSVASELLADDLINKCMQYLQAVHWSAAEEIQIGDVLSCLGLKPLPDLAARLENEDAHHIIFVERIIKEMVSLIQDTESKETIMRINAEKYIGGIFEGNTPRDVVEICEREIFQSSVRSRNISAIRSLSKFLDHCDGETLKAEFIAMLEDPEFMTHVKKAMKGLESDQCSEYPQLCEDVFYIIIWFMKATERGKIIISRASRNSFVTTWLPIMTDLCRERVDKFQELDEAVLNVVKGLPLADKIRICVEWIEVYKENHMDISTPLTLFIDLHDAHYKSMSKQQYPVFYY